MICACPVPPCPQWFNSFHSKFSRFNDIYFHHFKLSLFVRKPFNGAHMATCFLAERMKTWQLQREKDELVPAPSTIVRVAEPVLIHIDIDPSEPFSGASVAASPTQHVRRAYLLSHTHEMYEHVHLLFHVCANLFYFLISLFHTYIDLNRFNGRLLINLLAFLMLFLFRHVFLIPGITTSSPVSPSGWLTPARCSGRCCVSKIC
jgi:hypothetical protein